ncbi:MAG TPA: phosphocarrier protein HPr [Pseudogracilibacillus sp.]|nr:phosphocarrier protein HPr [Pseudogracilibacillus sp.]
MANKEFTITTDVGLHARPATVLVQKASQYKSDIELEHNDKKVNVKSIMGVMSLGLAKGAAFQLHVNGDDEDEALQGIEELFKSEGIAE